MIFRLNQPLVHTLHFVDDTAEVAFIVPVFNQAPRIEANLLSIAMSASLNFELVVVNDASTDASDDAILHAIAEITASVALCKKISYVVLKQSAFETKCDAIGFEVSKAHQIIEIQADMTIRDTGFDKRLRDMHRLHPDIFMISGRGVEKLDPIVEAYGHTAGSDRSSASSLFMHLLRRVSYQVTRRIPGIYKAASKPQLKEAQFEATPILHPSADDFAKTGIAGRVGEKIIFSDTLPSPFVPIYCGETVMRGPISFLRADYELLGGLDVRSFFQGYDEHDLVLRARLNLGKKSAYTPVIFDAPLEFGTTRAVRSIRSEVSIFANLLRIQKSRRQSALANYSRSPHLHLTPEILYFEN